MMCLERMKRVFRFVLCTKFMIDVRVLDEYC